MLILTKRYRSGPITRFNGSVTFVKGSILTIYPVIFRNCSRMQSEIDSRRRPWYLLAVALELRLRIKKNERSKPRKTPRKIKTDNKSISTVVFTYQN